MTLPLPAPTVNDFAGIQQNFDAIAQQFPVLGGIQNARILGGSFIGASGATAFTMGGGITCVRDAVGKYTLTLANGFPSTNYIILPSVFQGASGIGIASIRTDVTITPTKFGIATINSTALADINFYVVVIGSR